MKTKDVLRIYWDSELGEVDGQTFYLFSRDVRYIPPDFPLSLWPENTEIKHQKLIDIDGNNWIVWLWDVKFSTYPSEWRTRVKETLSFFLNQGEVHQGAVNHNAVNHSAPLVCWCGLDGCFVDPPDLFDPTEMPEGVYAAMNQDKVFYCHTDLEETFKSISESELLALQKFVAIQSNQLTFL